MEGIISQAGMLAVTELTLALLDNIMGRPLGE